MITYLVSILFISLYGVQVDCKVESYALTILEKGTMVKEIVEVDVDNQTEVFRVPQHNDVVAMDLMNDFNVGLSVRRIPSTQDCYVSKLDSSIPGPEKMRINMEQMWSQSLRNKASKTNQETKISEWKVIGLADRLALPQTFLDFCGGFPIYNIEKTSVDLIRSSLQEGRELFFEYILEKGTMVKEIVEVDVDNQTEVFRVPQHNDVDAMDLMNDFNVGVVAVQDLIPSTECDN
ncbi:hypothetical protein OS493_038765 [Desmophyllum pertusum]|uniref:BRICHOS domain-containing protein n=1 Tax=Desmophyllum pertusum TaxID=174260 RepID=A0A9W9ZJH1_9CNID|nr:hypothetical protein OS493_038765 [Desmophyllum pertusum]